MKNINGVTTTILLVIIWASSSVAVAQTTKYDLSKFRQPDFTRHEWLLRFGSGSSFGNQTNTDSMGTTKDKLFSSSFGMNTEYSFYKNTSKYQGMQRVYLSIAGLTEKNSVPRFKYEEAKNEFNLGTNWISENRFYVMPKFFFETNTSGYTHDRIYKNARKDFDNAGNEEKNNTLNDRTAQAFANIYVNIGIGRVEYVGDAETALFVMDDWQRGGIAQGTYSEQQVEDFAKFIARLRNKRIIDTRLKRIYEIEQLDSFARANNLLTRYEGKYFALLNDNWVFDSWKRETGWRVWAGVGTPLHVFKEFKKISTTYIFKDSTVIQYDTSKSYRKTFGVNIGLNYEKPLSLHWQQSFYIRASYNPLINIKERDQERDDKNAGITATAGWSYYPNTRTNISLTANISYSYNDFANFDNSMPHDKRHIFETGFNLKYYYYFSPRLQMTINSGIGYNSMNINVDVAPTYNKKWTGGFGIGFDYVIF